MSVRARSSRTTASRRSRRVRALRALAVLALLLGPVAASAQRVAVVATFYVQTEAEQVVAALEATGRFDEVVWDSMSVTASAAKLSAYDAVLFWQPHPQAPLAALGDALALYVDSGGGVVTVLNGYAYGRFTGSYLAIDPIGGYATGPAVTLGTLHLPSHPLLSGVSSFEDLRGTHTPSAVAPGATLVASLSNGAPLVAVRSVNGILRVDLGMNPNSNASGGTWTSTTDGTLLLANALEHVLRAQENLLVNGRFEYQTAIGSGPPAIVGEWSGDDATIVAAENGITPFEGTRMLRFDAANVGGASTNVASDIMQNVSLDPFLPLVSSERATARLSMRVNRVVGDAGTDRKFDVRIDAYAGDPTSNPSLADATVELDSDADLGTWEPIEVELALPPATNQLRVLLRAWEDVVNDTTAPEFDGHYADSVRLEIVDDGLPAPHSDPTVQLVWTGTTGDGVVGGPSIEAQNGDVLTASVYLSATELGLQSHDVSVLFDEALDDELDLVSATGHTVAFPVPVGGNPSAIQESNLSQRGEVLHLSAATVPPGPVSSTAPIGTLVFDVVNVATDGEDLRAEAGGPGAAMSNSGAPLAAAFGGAEVNAAVSPAAPVSSPHEMTWVLSPGNPADINGYGAVAYPYRISTYEVSNDHYVAFLNALDPTGANALALFTTLMETDPRGGIDFDAGQAIGLKYAAKSAAAGQRPVNFLTVASALRYVNWLENGRPNGTGTEDGSYDMTSAPPVREPGAGWVLPDLHEWYKATYYYNQGYTLYPTSASAPAVALCDAQGIVTNPGGSANYVNGCDFDGLNGHLSRANALGTSGPNPFLAADLVGNVWEYLESPIPASGQHYQAGGSYLSATAALAAATSLDMAADTSTVAKLGFRVALTPDGDTDEDGVPEDGFADGAVEPFANVTSTAILDRNRDVIASRCASGQTLGCDDNCPWVPNADQADFDGDRIGDVCDLCPYVVDPDQSDEDMDGTGDLCDPDVDGDSQLNTADTDSDGDGYDDYGPLGAEPCGPGSLLNCDDNCRFQSNGGSSVFEQTDCDEDGVGDVCDCDMWSSSSTDSDADGIVDGCDTCPYHLDTSNADSDGDGVGNACDGCPDVGTADQSDTDADGVGNPCDNCPATPNADQTDSDGDGVGDACDAGTDTDADGEHDAADNCPHVANPGQSDADGDGDGDACDPVPVPLSVSVDPNGWTYTGCDFFSTDVVNFRWADAGDPVQGACNFHGPIRDLGGQIVGLDIDYVPATSVIADCCVYEARDGPEGPPVPAEMIIVEMNGGSLTPYANGDGDQVIDYCDNCPADANVFQLDTDADGHGDTCDNCVVDYNPGQVDSDSDGIGDPCDLTPLPEPAGGLMLAAGLLLLRRLARRRDARAA